MDWMTASERMNSFARMDTSLANRLNDLSEHQARENKLAFAIESGRVYGLRAQKCDMRLKKQLNNDWQRPPVEQSF